MKNIYVTTMHEDTDSHYTIYAGNSEEDARKAGIKEERGGKYTYEITEFDWYGVKLGVIKKRSED